MNALASSTYRLDDITEVDAAAMRGLFADVFGKPMSAAFRQWKYRPGAGHGIGVWQGNALVAHYGGVGADVVIDGQPARAVQIVDVMVLPSVRQGVRSHSPFFLAASNFLERYIGYGRPYLLGYGFPSHRVFRLAEHLRLYAPVGGMSELSVAPVPLRWHERRWHWQAITRENYAQHQVQLDALWQAMLASFPQAILVRKDAERLHYRYLQHPEHQYHLQLLRAAFRRRALAAAALKVESQRVLLMDLIADARDFSRALTLLAAEVERRWHLPLQFWLSSAHAKPLLRDNITATELPIVTPANIWSPGPAPAELQDRWCLSAGDTDFL